MNIMEDQIWSNEQKNAIQRLAESTASKNCMFLEIGSWCGSSSIILAKVAQRNNGLLFCIDWWKGSENTALTDIATNNDIFGIFWSHVVNEGLEDVVIPIRGNSSIIHQIIKFDMFDLIFIDGDHRYNAIKNDIKNYKSLVKKGGIMSGHDCEGYIQNYDKDFLELNKNNDFANGIHCGVVLAVGESFTDYKIDNTIWSVQIT